jgi:cytochrome c2
VHFKRFQYTATSRRKLRNLVSFKTRNQSFSNIVAENKSNEGVSIRTSSRDGPTIDGGGAEEKEDDAKEGEELKEDKNVEHISQNDGRENAGYNLFGVVQHLGGLGAGHYVSTVRGDGEGKWKEYNDAHTRFVKEEEASLRARERSSIPGWGFDDDI